MKWWKRRSSNDEENENESELKHRWQYDYTMRKYRLILAGNGVFN